MHFISIRHGIWNFHDDDTNFIIDGIFLRTRKCGTLFNLAILLAKAAKTRRMLVS